VQHGFSSSFAAMSRNNFHSFVAHFTVDLVSQATSLANFTICINKMKTKSFVIYSEEITRNEVVDIPCVSFSAHSFFFPLITEA